MLSSYLTLLQILCLLLEIIGIALAYIELHNKELAKRLDQRIASEIKTTKFLLGLEPKMNWILTPIIMFGGLTTFMIGSDEILKKPDARLAFYSGVVLLSIGSYICLINLIFALTSYFSKRKRLGSFGLVLAGVGFVISFILFFATL